MANPYFSHITTWRLKEAKGMLLVEFLHYSRRAAYMFIKPSEPAEYHIVERIIIEPKYKEVEDYTIEHIINYLPRFTVRNKMYKLHLSVHQSAHEKYLRNDNGFAFDGYYYESGNKNYPVFCWHFTNPQFKPADLK